MSASSTTRIVRVAGGLTAAGALMFTVACGSAGTGSAASAGNASDPMAAFAECMSKQGVTLPNPGRAGAGRPTDRPTDRPTGRPQAGALNGRQRGAPTARPTGRPSGMPSLSADQQKAMQTCASLRPQGGPGGQGGPGATGAAPADQNGQGK